MKLVRSVALAAAPLLLAGVATAAVLPIPATGWNHDLVLNGPAPYSLSVTGTMDGGLGQFENQVWVEEGLYPVWNGTEVVADTQVFGFVAGTHSSLTGNGDFVFQPFDDLNAVALDGGDSGTLTLDTPAAYSAIALYGASGFGGKTATVTLTFADMSTSDYLVAQGTGIGTDWFNTNPDVAYVAGGRASNRREEVVPGDGGYMSIFAQTNAIISINETYLSLSAVDAGKMLTAVTITNTGGDRMAVFALSGQQVPEPASALLLGLAAVGLTARRRIG